MQKKSVGSNHVTLNFKQKSYSLCSKRRDGNTSVWIKDEGETKVTLVLFWIVVKNNK